MIQRIQSIFLLYIIILPLCFLSFPLLSGTLEEESIHYRMDATEFYTLNDSGDVLAHVDDTSLLRWMFIAIAAVGLIALFSFRNRIRQIRLCMINYLFIGLTIVLIANFWFPQLEDFPLDTLSSISLVRLLFLFLLLVANLIAITNIRKDEDMVRASDRIR